MSSKLYSSSDIVKILFRDGFVFISQKGSHAKYEKIEGGKTLTVIVPMGRREIPRGTLKSIFRQAGLAG